MDTIAHAIDTICIVVNVWLNYIIYIWIYHWNLVKSKLIIACLVV